MGSTLFCAYPAAAVLCFLIFDICKPDYCKAQASTSQGPAVVDQAFSLSPDAQSPEPDYEYGVYDEWGDDPVEITVSAPVDIAALGICTRNMIKLLDNLNSSETPISLFMDALHSTGVADILHDSSLGGTVFAPTDAAFRSLADQLKMPLEELMNSPILVPIVLNHIVGYKVWTWDLWGDHSLPTLAALNVDMTVADVYDRPDVKDFNNYSVQLSIAGFVAYAIEADICNCEDPCNIVASIIDAVLLPDILKVETKGRETLLTLADSYEGEVYFKIVQREQRPANSSSGAQAQEYTGWIPSRLQHGGEGIEAPSTENGLKGKSATMTFYRNVNKRYRYKGS